MQPRVVPPSTEELQTFSLGKCEPGRALEIESYLEGAADCTSILEAAEDELVRRLRGAGELPRVDAAHLAPNTLPSLAGPAAATGDTANAVEPQDPAELGAEAAALVDHPRYRLIRRLGQGGMGTVYLAEHRLMRRQVAIKLVRSRYLGNPQFIERFRREMQAAASLSHPHIVTAHDAEEMAGTHFLVMEFVEGEPLDRWLARHGPLPIAEACTYIRQAALGLQLAHEKGTVHRDIKPHNLMRTEAGTIKILDFGLARVIREAAQPAGDHITAEGTVMGTADYMAPEQGRDSHRADIRADIYSLGCTLYHLLSGSVPFPQGTTIGKILKHTVARPEPLSSHRADVPPELVRVLDKMMAKKPEDRYQTPGEVAVALEAFTLNMSAVEAGAVVKPAQPQLRSEGEESAEAQIIVPQEKPAPRRWLILAGAIGIVVLFGVALLAWSNGWFAAR